MPNPDRPSPLKELVRRFSAEISEHGYRDRVLNRFLAQIRDLLNARADDVAKYVH
jgi:hypothetical protein